MTSPSVSIIIPCFNAERFIGEAVESALGQAYAPLEVVVIDDGSTDGSINVLRSYGDRIRWETGPNRGACAARNRGIELAQGELIQFLDADDLLDSEKLSRQVPVLKRSAADLVFCNVTETNLLSGTQTGLYRPRERSTFRQACFDKIQTSAPLHRRDNLQAVGGFDEHLPCAQERDLHLRLACQGLEFEHLDESLVTHRRRAGSLSSDTLRVFDQHLAITMRAFDILKAHGTATEERRRALAGLLARDARYYLTCGVTDRAMAYFATAKEIHPDGGIDHAYSRPTRWLRRLVGPTLTEKLVQQKRRARRYDSPSAAIQ
ncbi:MAG: glycosyltransferase [Planctomycetaceae bacterium]|nr:glycosyltransferase [Planctomycetaceae bacterium]